MAYSTKKPLTQSVREQIMNPIRKGIKGVLELLASKEEQSKYEQNVQIANVPAELICMWFDDTYHPDSMQHKEAFSIEERKVLSSFNEFYDSRVEKLPKTLEAMHKNSLWDEIVKEAQATIDSIKW